MIRTIVAFHSDGPGVWVAELSCSHTQHIRHRPPFQERPWVLDADARAARVGTSIECPLCDRAEFPDGLTMLGQAGPWDLSTLPRGLLRAHRIAEGRWGRLLVHEGSIAFQFETDDPAGPPRHLTAGCEQPIPPGAAHHVIASADFSIELEFWGRVSRPG